MKADAPGGLAGRPQRDIVVVAAAVLLAALLVITMVGPTSARFFDAALQPAEIHQRGVTEGESGPVIAATSHGSLPVTAAPVAAAARTRSTAQSGGVPLVPRRDVVAATRVTALDPGAVFAASSTLDSASGTLLATSIDDSSTVTYSLNATTDGELTGDSGFLALSGDTDDADPAGHSRSTVVDRRGPAVRDRAATAKPRSGTKARVGPGKRSAARPAPGRPVHRPAQGADQPQSQRRR